MRLSLHFTICSVRALLAVSLIGFAQSAVAQDPLGLLVPSPSATPTTASGNELWRLDPNSTGASQAIVPTMTPLHPAQPPVAPSGAGPLLERSTLTGDWGGYRSELQDDGVKVNLSTTQYYQGVASGGVDQGFRYGGRNDYFLNFDGEKVGLWKGLFIDMHGETRYGQSAYNLTGALLPPNLMMVVPQPTGTVTALTAVKVSQFLSEQMLVFGGRLNMFDGFVQPLTGATGLNGFMNTAMIFNPVLARTIPYSTYGAGFAYLKDFEPVFSVAVIDTYNTPTVTGFDTFFNNGATVVSALNVPTRFFGLPGHQGVTGTYSSGTYNDLQPSPYFDPNQGPGIALTNRTGSWSMTYNFDQALYAAPNDPKNIWGVFGSFGVSDGNPNPIRWCSNMGISGRSPLQGRSQDTFGAGYYYAAVSSTIKEIAPKLLRLQNEQGVEMFYNYAVTQWFHITPDLQVIDPFRQRVDAGFLAGVRAKVDF